MVANIRRLTVFNLAENAHMLPQNLGASVTDVGATWVLNAYTVPGDRVFELHRAVVANTGGAVPTITEIITNGPRRLERRVPAVNVPIIVTGPIWLLPNTVVTFQNTGGDATTDMVWSLYGVEYDWSNFNV